MKTSLHSFPVKKLIIWGHEHYFTFLNWLVGLEDLDQACGNVKTVVDLGVMQETPSVVDSFGVGGEVHVPLVLKLLIQVYVGPASAANKKLSNYEDLF